MNVLLTGAIIFAIGVAILVGFSLKRMLKKKNKNIRMQQQSSSLEYIDSWEQEKEVVSSEKIKQIKEKELERKAREEIIKTDRNGEKKKNQKENNKINEILQPFESVRAGEVQRKGGEQFNLRKDEPMSDTSDENWWGQ